MDEEYGFFIESLADKVKRETILQEDYADPLGSDGIILYAVTEDELNERITRNGLKQEDGTVMKGPVKRYVLYYRTNS